MFVAWQGGEKKSPSLPTAPRRTPSPEFYAQPPLYDSEEPKPRILNVVLDSQSNKYGEKWVRVWRRAIKMIEEPKGVIYDEGEEEPHSENLTS